MDYTVIINHMIRYVQVKFPLLTTATPFLSTLTWSHTHFHFITLPLKRRPQKLGNINKCFKDTMDSMDLHKNLTTGFNQLPQQTNTMLSDVVWLVVAKPS